MSGEGQRDELPARHSPPPYTEWIKDDSMGKRQRRREREPVLRATQPRWWQFGQRSWRRYARRQHPNCSHPYPTHGDERMHYGLRCGVCFVPVEFVENASRSSAPSTLTP